ncbi:MAG: TRAP transporter substrate-binding protein [Lachnospiraceae bacterium]|jgi:tripartite ATP-independent transporter DctP family solute receptor
MKKRVSVLLAAALVSSMLAGCGGSSDTAATTAAAPGTTAAASTEAKEPAAANPDAIVLKLGYSTNEEDPRAKAAEEFKKEVEEKTGGAVVIETYPSGQLGGDAALIEAMALDSGTVDIIITDASNFATYEPKMGISALPFQFSTFEDAWAFMDSEVEKEAEDLLIEQNMRVLAHYDNGFRCVTNSKKEVKTPADMANVLIRTPENPVIMATMKALGANPQPLAFSELYQALQQGTYDAQENPIPVIYNNNLFEVQKYLSVTNHIYSGMCFTITESTWKKLSPEQQQIVSDAALASAEFNRELNKKQTEEFIAALEEKGMVITEPDLAPFAEATAGVAAELESTYGDLLDKLEAWKAGR